MNEKNISKDPAPFTFGDVKVGDMLLDLRGFWYMKISADYFCEEGEFEPLNHCAVRLDTGKMEVFEDDYWVQKFFRPKEIHIK